MVNGQGGEGRVGKQKAARGSKKEKEKKKPTKTKPKQNPGDRNKGSLHSPKRHGNKLTHQNRGKSGEFVHAWCESSKEEGKPPIPINLARYKQI